MRQTPALTWNVTGQTLEVRFGEGRPTSGTFAVYRSNSGDDSVAEFSGTATLDTVNTSLSAAAGPTQSDPQRLALASVAGIVSTRRYLLSVDGRREWVTPIEIGASHIRARYPLQSDFASGALVQSTTLTAAVDATFVALTSSLSDLSDTYPDYRVKWTIVYSGKTYVLYTFFDVVRSQVEHRVDMDDVNARAPGLFDTLPVEYRVDEGRPLIDSAWRAVRAHLVASGLDANGIHDNEAIDELTVLRALRIVAEGGWHPPAMDLGTYMTITTSNYDRFFEQHFQATLKHRTAPGSAVPQHLSYWRK